MILPKRKEVWLMVALLPFLASPAAKSQEHATQLEQGVQKRRKPAINEASAPKARSNHEQHAPPAKTPAQPAQQPANTTPPDQKKPMAAGEHEQLMQAQQPTQKPPEGEPAIGQQEHHMGRISTVKPEFPRMGKSQENPPAPLIGLEELEQ